MPRFFEELRADGTAGVERLVNLAISGETSESLMRGGQLDRALRLIRETGEALRVVTLDIGGNDLLYLAATQPCASAPNGSACREAVIRTLGAYEANFRAIVSRLVEALAASAPRARLMTLTYYNPFSGTGHEIERPGDLALLGDDRRIDCKASAASRDDRGLNDIVACVAAELTTDRLAVEVVDVQPTFVGRGFELTLIGLGDIHANDAGYAVMAAHLAAAFTGRAASA